MGWQRARAAQQRFLQIWVVTIGHLAAVLDFGQQPRDRPLTVAARRQIRDHSDQNVGRHIEHAGDVLQFGRQRPCPLEDNETSIRELQPEEPGARDHRLSTCVANECGKGRFGRRVRLDFDGFVVRRSAKRLCRSCVDGGRAFGNIIGQRFRMHGIDRAIHLSHSPTDVLFERNPDRFVIRATNKPYTSYGFQRTKKRSRNVLFREFVKLL